MHTKLGWQIEIDVFYGCGDETFATGIMESVQLRLMLERMPDSFERAFQRDALRGLLPCTCI